MYFQIIKRYLITDLLETDLATIIKSPQDLSDEHIKFFLY
jgi:hypothetical protein